MFEEASELLQAASAAFENFFLRPAHVKRLVGRRLFPHAEKILCYMLIIYTSKCNDSFYIFVFMLSTCHLHFKSHIVFTGSVACRWRLIWCHTLSVVEAATARHHLRGCLTSLSLLLNLCVCSVCEWSPAGLACFVWLVASRSLSVGFVIRDAAGPAYAACVQSNSGWGKWGGNHCLWAGEQCTVWTRSAKVGWLKSVHSFLSLTVCRHVKR